MTEIAIFLSLLGIILAFAMVVLFGAPYVPTLSKQKWTALDLLDLKKGQTLLELGCGDGRIARAAATRGLKVTAIELNPLLFFIAWLVTFKYRKNVRLVWGNFWKKKWPEADGIFVFLIDSYMPKLDQKIKQSQAKPTRLASFAFKIPGKKMAKEKDGVLLYLYQ